MNNHNAWINHYNNILKIIVMISYCYCYLTLLSLLVFFATIAFIIWMECIFLIAFMIDLGEVPRKLDQFRYLLELVPVLNYNLLKMLCPFLKQVSYWIHTDGKFSPLVVCLFSISQVAKLSHTNVKTLGEEFGPIMCRQQHDPDDDDDAKVNCPPIVIA